MKNFHLVLPIPKIIPKNTPTATTWWVVFCVWVRHVNNSCNFDPEQDWETNVKNSWRNAPKNLFWTNSHLGDKSGTLVKGWNLGGTFRGTFRQPKMDLPQRTSESPKAILPWYYGWRPQSYCGWGKTQRLGNDIRNLPDSSWFQNHYVDVTWFEEPARRMPRKS